MNDDTSKKPAGKLTKVLRIGCMSAGILMVVFIVIILAIAIPQYRAYQERSNSSVNPTIAVRQAASLGKLIRDHAQATDANAAARVLMGKQETESIKGISSVLPSFQLPPGHPFNYTITFVMPDVRDGVRFCITATLNRGGDGTGGRVYYHSNMQNVEGWIDRSSITHFQTGKEPARTCQSEMKSINK